MKCKVLTNARIVMAVDGSKQLFVDTGYDFIPLNNRLVSSEMTKVDILPESTLMFDFEDVAPFPCVYFPDLLGLVPGQMYTVVYDGQKFECTCINIEGFAYCVGNTSFLESDTPDFTREPFLIVDILEGGVGLIGLYTTEAAEHTMSISTITEVVQKLDKKYIPDGVGGGNVHVLDAKTSNVGGLDMTKYAAGDVILVTTS